jgi:hypothetical protein
MEIFLKAFDDVKTIVIPSTFQNKLESLLTLMENSNDDDQTVIEALNEIRSLFKSFLKAKGLTNSSEKLNENVNSFSSRSLDDQLGNPQEIQHLFKKLEERFTKFFLNQNNQVQTLN